MRPGWAAPRTCAVAWAAEGSSALARGRNTSPASVSRVLCGVRSNRRAPICCSRRRICRLNDGCATRSSAAARPKCRCSATATKYPTSRRSRSTRCDAESVMSDLGRSRGAVDPPSAAAKGARSDDRHQEARRQGHVGKRSAHHCRITLIHQHAKGQGQEALLEGAHPVLTHLLPLCGGDVLLGKRKHSLLFERSVFGQDPYQIIEHRCESVSVAAESAPVTEPTDRFVVRSRDGLMLFP